MTPIVLDPIAILAILAGFVGFTGVISWVTHVVTTRIMLKDVLEMVRYHHELIHKFPCAPEVQREVRPPEFGWSSAN